MVGKYCELQDAYKSISESFIHAGAVNRCKVNVKWIHSEKITKDNVADKLKDLKGILVAPGFGHRGIDGKIEATRFARENNIPFLGICLGMQIAVIEYARNVLKYKDADSTEMNEMTKYPVISLMEEQKGITDMGGTMRLGSYACKVDKNSLLFDAYKSDVIYERHRHRYEFNDEYRDDFEKTGMRMIGINPDTSLVEAVQIEGHKWFVGVQFHPEYSSTVLRPSPLFVGFIKSTLV